MQIPLGLLVAIQLIGNETPAIITYVSRIWNQG